MYCSFFFLQFSSRINTMLITHFIKKSNNAYIYMHTAIFALLLQLYRVTV